LVILTFLLNLPSYFDQSGFGQRCIVQISDNTLPFIVEDEVIGYKRLHDRSTRWVGMHVDFLSRGLGVFAQARPKVAAKSHNVKQKILNLILVTTGFRHSP
jgi:hypothetical protein